MTSIEIALYILVTAAVTFAVRALPLALIRREIKNRRVRAFLYYVPFVTLSVMTFPDILRATGDHTSGSAALIAAISAALLGNDLPRVAAAASIAALIVMLVR